jgi:hypothetical protein
MPAYPPRAMRAATAAAYLDFEEQEFLKLVELRKLPEGFWLGDKIVRWDRLSLDRAVDEAKDTHEDTA